MMAITTSSSIRVNPRQPLFLIMMSNSPKNVTDEIEPNEAGIIQSYRRNKNRRCAGILPPWPVSNPPSQGVVPAPVFLAAAFAAALSAAAFFFNSFGDAGLYVRALRSAYSSCGDRWPWGCAAQELLLVGVARSTTERTDQ